VVTAAPSVSIAIRAYRRTWLGEAISSVLAQTYEDLELVVYDDAGDLQDAVDAFSDERVRYHRGAERLGDAGRYLAALRLCRGRYFGLLDDDDRYEPTFVQRLLAALEREPRAAAAVSRVAWDDGRRLVPPSDARLPGIQVDAVSALFRLRWLVTPSMALVRRAAFDEGERTVPMPDGVAPDVFMTARAAAAGWQFVLVDEPLVVRRSHEGQVSRRKLNAHNCMVSTWRELKFEDPQIETLRREQLAEALKRRGAWYLLQGDARTARSDLEAARAADPGSWSWKRRPLAVAAAIPLLGRPALWAWSAVRSAFSRRSSALN